MCLTRVQRVLMFRIFHSKRFSRKQNGGWLWLKNKKAVECENRIFFVVRAYSYGKNVILLKKYTIRSTGIVATKYLFRKPIMMEKDSCEAFRQRVWYFTDIHGRFVLQCTVSMGISDSKYRTMRKH